MQAQLVLEDGRVFPGRYFGGVGQTEGEVVFNTSMTGYQEVLTDPSYCGQIVVMTCPQIGNYGVNPQDQESARPWVRAMIVREVAEYTSNWRSRIDLNGYLRQWRVTGLTGVDTRALTRHIRDQGAMRGVIASADESAEALAEQARASAPMTGADHVGTVTCDEPYPWRQGYELGWSPRAAVAAPGEPRYRVIAYDFGVKQNILRSLVHSGCELTVVPAMTPAEDVLALEPDGVFLSNGPGDPAAVEYGIENTRRLIGKLPLFGICLGHQILSLALGAKTYKLKFGHRGGNQPVKRLATGAVEITAQNHGFAVDPDSLPDACEVTHLNLNDQTCEGFAHRDLPLFSVQYHPEASPGPHDATYLFERFTAMMEAHRPAKQDR